LICRGGHLHDGVTTLTVERGSMTLVLKGVPARVCDTCGEGYVDEPTTQRVESVVDRLQAVGVQLVMQEFVAA
jgi:YgiT-type zinc finger domain-containing protein